MDNEQQKTRYELFVINAKNNRETYRQDISGNGSFEYTDQALSLMDLANNLNMNLFVYLFGKQLGEHLAYKFVMDCNRDLLKFFGILDSQYRFFLLHELKTNEQLFIHC